VELYVDIIFLEKHTVSIFRATRLMVVVVVVAAAMVAMAVVVVVVVVVVVIMGLEAYQLQPLFAPAC
jgi:hypothetical protein